jgi:D-arginine dehydrogenase
MDVIETDIVVIGGGIAGAAAAAHLAPHSRVVLLEMEPTAGYHSTGRSAAVWILNYGPPDVRALTGASRAFFEAPPASVIDAPIMSRRPCLFLAPESQSADLDDLLADAQGLAEIAVADAHRMVAALRPGYATRAAIEHDSFDMDVAALHAGFLRLLRAAGGHVVLGAPVERIDRANGHWRVFSGERAFAARAVVNAAGAWADTVASLAGVAPIGITPKRRTACIVEGPANQDPAWPLMGDVAGTWYSRPEARTKLLVSPADETPVPPHDVQPDEIDIATGIANMQEALDVPVRRVEHAWAGLRSFAPDGSLVIGEDPTAARFFWMAGQGGYGIQTSPAAGSLLAALVLGRPHDAGLAARVSPSRFRS